MPGISAFIDIEMFKIVKDFLFMVHPVFNAIRFRVGDEAGSIGEGERIGIFFIFVGQRMRIEERGNNFMMVETGALFRYSLETAQILDGVLTGILLNQAVGFDPGVDDHARIDDAIGLDMGARHNRDLHGDPDIVFNNDGRELGRISHRDGQKRPVGIDGAARPQAGIKAQRDVFKAMKNALNP